MLAILSYSFSLDFFLSYTERTRLALIICPAADAEPLSERIAPLRKYAQSGEINSKVADASAVLGKIKAAFPGYFELDGVSVDLWKEEGWWFNVRMSNTEPLVRLNLEAKTKEQMEERRDAMLALIRG